VRVVCRGVIIVQPQLGFQLYNKSKKSKLTFTTVGVAVQVRQEAFVLSGIILVDVGVFVWGGAAEDTLNA